MGSSDSNCCGSHGLIKSDDPDAKTIGRTRIKNTNEQLREHPIQKPLSHKHQPNCNSIPSITLHFDFPTIDNNTGGNTTNKQYTNGENNYDNSPITVNTLSTINDTGNTSNWIENVSEPNSSDTDISSFSDVQSIENDNINQSNLQSENSGNDRDENNYQCIMRSADENLNARNLLTPQHKLNKEDMDRSEMEMLKEIRRLSVSTVSHDDTSIKHDSYSDPQMNIKNNNNTPPQSTIYTQYTNIINNNKNENIPNYNIKNTSNWIENVYDNDSDDDLQSIISYLSDAPNTIHINQSHDNDNYNEYEEENKYDLDNMPILQLPHDNNQKYVRSVHYLRPEQIINNQNLLTPHVAKYWNKEDMDKLESEMLTEMRRLSVSTVENVYDNDSDGHCGENSEISHAVSGQLIPGADSANLDAIYIPSVISSVCDTILISNQTVKSETDEHTTAKTPTIGMKTLISEINEVENNIRNQSINSDVLIEHPLIQEIIRNENEYRKYIRTTPNGQNTESNGNNKPNNNNNNSQQNHNNSNGNNNRDWNNNPNKQNEDDEKDDKQDNNDNFMQDEYDIDMILKKVAILKQHEKYKIMYAQQQGLSDSELVALVYYTERNSCCHKMKQSHRRLILANATQWKQLYFDCTNAVLKMYSVFHYKNMNKMQCQILYHGSSIQSLDVLSQEQLFLKTLFSFSTRFDVAKSFTTGSILIIDNISESLYCGTLKGADVTWISKWDESEIIILPTTYYNWREIKNEERIRNNWNVKSNIKIYFSSDYVSNNDPLKAHSDNILSTVKPNYDQLYNNINRKYKHIKHWLQHSDLGLNKTDVNNYFNSFIDNGYYTFKFIKDIDKEELIELGVKRAHIKTFLRKISALKIEIPKISSNVDEDKKCDETNIQYQQSQTTISRTLARNQCRVRDTCDDENCEFIDADTIPTNQFAPFTKAEREHISKFHQYLHLRLKNNELEEQLSLMNSDKM